MRKSIQNTCLAVLFILVGAQAGNAAVCSLVLAGSSCLSFGAPGANFYEAGIAPTGSGVIQSFVRIAGSTDYVHGYNTDGALQYDENPSPTFTHSLLLTAVPIVNIGGTDYREFLLDINQTGADPLLTLDRVVVYLRASGALSDGSIAHHADLGAGALFPSGALVYDSGNANSIELDYSLHSGSGQGDMYMYIPNSAFVGGTYVYLYSQFGPTPNNNNDGFEEWAVKTAVNNPVPEPKHFAFTAVGAILLFLMDYRRRRRNNLA